jgi:SAM-dependent methyltransferase
MTGASSAAELAGGTCTAPAERSDRMRDIVLAHVPSDRPIRLLDVGCGTGSLLYRLSDALPHATLVGIDLSAANIEAASREQTGRRSNAPLHFEVADYLRYTAAAPFDAIVADGVLHLIGGDTDILVRKLAGDLRSGGVLVCSMPFECAYNEVFALVRRLLGRVRSGALDRAILQVGRVLHRSEMNDDRLRERVAYMYLPPERMMGPPLARAFASAGLSRCADYPMRSTSLSQLKHRVTIFVRE